METSYGTPCVDMRDIGRNTRSADDVVEGEVANAGVELQEEREGLSDSSRRAQDCDFGGLSIDKSPLVSQWMSAGAGGQAVLSELTLAALAEKALRVEALRSERVTWRVANMMAGRIRPRV